MKSKILKAVAVFCLFCGCAVNNQESSQSSNSNTENQENDSFETKKDDIEIEGSQIIQDNTIDLSKYTTPLEINKAGTYNLSGSFQSMLIIDTKEDVQLNLKGVSIINPEGPCIFIRKANHVTIACSKENTLEMKNTAYEVLNACIYSKADLTLNGKGSLNINSSHHGIKAKDTFASSNLALKITAEKDGIHSNETMKIQSGTYDITSKTDEAFQSETDLIIEGGTFVLNAESDTIRAENELTIQDGKIDIVSGNEGIESKNSLTINGGDLSITSYDDGLNAANALTINGGNLNIVSQSNDGIDSNGSLIINGGNIFSCGLNPPEQAFDTDNTPFEINGGVVIGIGSTIIQPTEAKQNTIIIGQYSNILSIVLKEGETTILEKNIENTEINNFSSGCLTLSSDKIQKGKTYDLYINGELAESITIDSQINVAGNVNEMNGPQGGPGGMPGQNENPFEMPGPSNQPPERRNP